LDAFLAAKDEVLAIKERFIDERQSPRIHIALDRTGDGLQAPGESFVENPDGVLLERAVTPAQAGVQEAPKELDSGFCRNDETGSARTFWTHS